VKINYLGKIADSDWPHFLFDVVIGSEHFQYKTGVGHFTPYNRGTKPKQSVIADTVNQGWVHIPKENDILDALISDADVGSMSFNEFCDNLGYSSDSLKALDIYRACMETSVKLRRALGKEYGATVERINALRESGDL
jgi:hypothetical protein